MISSQRWMIRGKRDVALEQFEFNPGDLEPRQIAVENEYTAVSPGTECANYLALDPDVSKPGSWCVYPWKPGYAGVGRVIAKGDAVSEYEIGERVIGWFGHASHVKDSADWTVAPAHPEINPQYAPYTRILGIAHTALEVISPDAFAPVGVWGLGLIGNLVAQLMRNSGLRVIGIDPIEARRKMAERCDITVTLDPNSDDFAERLQAITPEGLSIGVDAVGQAATTLSMPQFLAQRGQMVLMTHWRSQPLIDGNDFMHLLFRKGITLRGALDGSNAGLMGAKPGSDWAALQRQKYGRLQNLIVDEKLHIAPLISHIVRPEECSETYEGLSFDRDHWWGAVVDWRDGQVEIQR